MKNQNQKTNQTISENDKAKIEAASIKSALDNAVKAGLTLQDQWQQCLIMATCYALRFNDSSYIELVLNRSIEVKFLRTESLTYWVRQVAGFVTTYDKESNKFIHTKRNKDLDFKSDHGVVFTWDKFHVKALKDKKLHFWVIAPVDDGKILKLDADWDKVSTPFVNKLARNILAGQMTDEEVLTHIASIHDQLKTALTDKKNKEWVAKYLTQTNETLEDNLTKLLES